MLDISLFLTGSPPLQKVNIGLGGAATQPGFPLKRTTQSRDATVTYNDAVKDSE